MAKSTFWMNMTPARWATAQAQGYIHEHDGEFTLLRRNHRVGHGSNLWGMTMRFGGYRVLVDEGPPKVYAYVGGGPIDVFLRIQYEPKPEDGIPNAEGELRAVRAIPLSDVVRIEGLAQLWQYVGKRLLDPGSPSRSD